MRYFEYVHVDYTLSTSVQGDWSKKPIGGDVVSPCTQTHTHTYAHTHTHTKKKKKKKKKTTGKKAKKSVCTHTVRVRVYLHTTYV